MANVISSFLVGIGFDYDRKGADAIGSGIDSIKSKALQLGAVVAGAFGIKALTVDFADSKAMLGRFADIFGVTANDVQAFGRAMESEGGSLESFMAQLEEIERRRARIRIGDVGWFPSAGKAFVNPNDIANAKDAIEAFRILAKAMQSADQKGRILIAEAFGLDEPAIALLSKGVGNLDAVVAKYKEIQPLNRDMTNAAAEFNRQWVEMKSNIGGAADELSNRFLPVITDITKSVNSWFDVKRDNGGVFRVLFDKEYRDQIYNRMIEDNKEIKSDPYIFEDGAQQEIDDPDIIRYLNISKDPLTIRENISDSVKSGISSKEELKQIPTAQKIEISLNLDGTVLDRRTVDVVNGIAQTTLDDLTSSVLS